jgi:hypothetical protein
MSAASSASAELDVAANAGQALLTVGPDLTTDHACTGAPLRCTHVTPIALSASAPGIAPEEVAFAWTVEPPADRALSPSRRVTFSPSAAVAGPSVTIETDGEAISGDWTFRVQARDAAGVIGDGATRVSVMNRAPAIVGGTPPVPDHTFDGSRFTALGEVHYTASDPDGDPLLAPTVEFRHAGDGPSTFVGMPLDAPPRVEFSMVVPYTSPGDAAWLIGGAGLERTIALGISDVNGAQDLETWPITVGNRAPAPVSLFGSATVHHGYDAARARYFADATVATWADPDADPLLPGGATGDGVCSSYDAAGGNVVVHCVAPYPGAPDLSSILGRRLVSFGVRDPWTPASGSSAWVEVLNRPPRIVSTSVSVDVPCWEGGCCRTNADGECVATSKTLPDGTLSVPKLLADDDGDPLGVVVNGSPLAPCVASSCEVSAPVNQSGPFCGSGSATETWNVSASDGAATASATVSVTRRCE